MNADQKIEILKTDDKNFNSKNGKQYEPQISKNSFKKRIGVESDQPVNFNVIEKLEGESNEPNSRNKNTVSGNENGDKNLAKRKKKQKNKKSNQNNLNCDEAIYSIKVENNIESKIEPLKMEGENKNEVFSDVVLNFGLNKIDHFNFGKDSKNHEQENEKAEFETEDFENNKNKEKNEEFVEIKELVVEKMAENLDLIIQNEIDWSEQSKNQNEKETQKNENLNIDSNKYTELVVDSTAIPLQNEDLDCLAPSPISKENLADLNLLRLKTDDLEEFLKNKQRMRKEESLNLEIEAIPTNPCEFAENNNEDFQEISGINYENDANCVNSSHNFEDNYMPMKKQEAYFELGIIKEEILNDKILADFSRNEEKMFENFEEIKNEDDVNFGDELTGELNKNISSQMRIGRKNSDGDTEVSVGFILKEEFNDNLIENKKDEAIFGKRTGKQQTEELIILFDQQQLEIENKNTIENNDQKNTEKAEEKLESEIEIIKTDEDEEENTLAEKQQIKELIIKTEQQLTEQEHVNNLKNYEQLKTNEAEKIFGTKTQKQQTEKLIILFEEQQTELENINNCENKERNENELKLEGKIEITKISEKEEIENSTQRIEKQQIEELKIETEKKKTELENIKNCENDKLKNTIEKLECEIGVIKISEELNCSNNKKTKKIVESGSPQNEFMNITDSCNLNNKSEFHVIEDSINKTYNHDQPSGYIQLSIVKIDQSVPKSEEIKETSLTKSSSDFKPTENANENTENIQKIDSKDFKSNLDKTINFQSLKTMVKNPKEVENQKTTSPSFQNPKNLSERISSPYERTLVQVNQLKVKGDEEYTWQNYQISIDLYHQALDTLFKDRRELPKGSIELTLYVKILANVSTCMQKMNRFEESLFYCKKVIEFEPSYIKAHYRAAQALKALKRNEEALVVLKEGMPYAKNSIDIELQRSYIILYNEQVQVCNGLINAMQGQLKDFYDKKSVSAKKEIPKIESEIFSGKTEIKEDGVSQSAKITVSCLAAGMLVSSLFILKGKSRKAMISLGGSALGAYFMQSLKSIWGKTFMVSVILGFNLLLIKSPVFKD